MNSMLSLLSNSGVVVFVWKGKYNKILGIKKAPNWGLEWSERRDSNSRPSPWQGDALPTELLSRYC